MDALKGLNTAQRQAVLHTTGPLLIVAGAGAGKTKTITHRIAHLIESGVPARAILALTFTNKAAGEMRERVRRLLGGSAPQPLLTTFHSLCVRLLREFAGKAGVSANFLIWDRDDQSRAMKRILKAQEMQKENVNVILSSISREKGKGIRLAEYTGAAKSYRQRDIARLWEAYERELHEARALDFDDLLLKAEELLRTSEEVRSLLQDRWTHIMIDEYQDTNVVQYEIARLLTGPRGNVCVVGDLDQCIYTWRQARLENLLSFERLFPGTTTVRLEENYRSTGTIIGAADDVIQKNKNRIPKQLRATREVGESIYLFEARDEMDEAWFVGQKIQELLERGARPREIAVLYRNNSQSRALEQSLLTFGIPYRVIGTRFFERKEVKDVLAYVRASLHSGSQDIARIVAIPPRGIGHATLSKILAGKESELSAATRAKLSAFRELLEGMRRALETLPLSEALHFVIETSGLERMYKESNSEEEAEHFENVKELVNLAVAFDHEEPPTGALALLEEAALQSDQDELREGEDRVSLMTVHASKGLEFKTVFVTGLEQGLFPSLTLDEHTDPEEERRLLYVAMTRAADRLFLTYARSRLRYGSREASVPSEFLADIDSRFLSWASESEAIIT